MIASLTKTNRQRAAVIMLTEKRVLLIHLFKHGREY